MIPNIEALVQALEATFLQPGDDEVISIVGGRLYDFLEVQYDLYYKKHNAEEEELEALREKALEILNDMRDLARGMGVMEKLGFTSLVEVDDILEAKWEGFIRDAEGIYLVVGGDDTVGYLNCRTRKVYLERDAWSRYEGLESWYDCLGIDFHKTLTEAELNVNLIDWELEPWDTTQDTK